MAHTNQWDETEPTSSTEVTGVATHLRKLATDVRERMGVDHDVASSDSGESTYWQHKKVKFKINTAGATSDFECCLFPRSGDYSGDLQVKDINGEHHRLWFIGEIRFYMGTTAPDGWLYLDGLTVGDGSSGADHAAYCYQSLFIELWNNLADAQAPVSGGRGVSAIADFLAHKRLTLPNAKCRIPVGAGQGSGLSNRTMGDKGGGENKAWDHAHASSHSHSISNVSDHTHTAVDGSLFTDGGGVSGNIETNPGGGHSHGDATDAADAGVITARAAFDAMNPGVVFGLIIKV